MIDPETPSVAVLLHLLECHVCDALLRYSILRGDREARRVWQELVAAHTVGDVERQGFSLAVVRVLRRPLSK